jgi:two-component system, LytTR family, response regulator
MEQIKVLIVEDEGITAESLRDVLLKLGYLVSGIAADALGAIDILNNDDTDMAILDINIQGDKDGIWVANLIQKKYQIPFIFLTAYEDEKILENAIKTKPYGYLVKPFTKTDISAAIKLGLQNFSNKTRADSFNSDMGEGEFEPFKISNTIFIKDNYMFKKVVVSEITMLKSDGHYVEIYTNQKKYLVRSKLSDFTSLLPYEIFVKVHRSYVVNINNIEKFDSAFLYIGDIQVPLSTSHRDELIKRLKTFLPNP